MPMGDVRLWEFAEAVRDRIRDEVSYVASVEVVDADPDDIEGIRKGMGRDDIAIRLSFPTDAAITPEPALGRTMEYRFGLIATVLFRKIGNTLRRLDDPLDKDITRVVKDVIAAVDGSNLGIMNQGGVKCGPVRLKPSGDSLQAMQFAVTGRSRESRS